MAVQSPGETTLCPGDDCVVDLAADHAIVFDENGLVQASRMVPVTSTTPTSGRQSLQGTSLVMERHPFRPERERHRVGYGNSGSRIRPL